MLTQTMYHLSIFFRVNLIICCALNQKCVAISTFLLIEKSRHGWLAEPKPHPKLYEQQWATQWSRFKMSSLNSCSSTCNLCKDTTQHKLYLFVTIKHSHTMRALILLLLTMFHLTSIRAGTRTRALSRRQTTTTTSGRMDGLWWVMRYFLCRYKDESPISPTDYHYYIGKYGWMMMMIWHAYMHDIKCVEYVIFCAIRAGTRTRALSRRQTTTTTTTTEDE